MAFEVAFEETWRARIRLGHGEIGGIDSCRRSSGDWRGKMRRTRHLLQRERIGGEGVIAGLIYKKIREEVQGKGNALRVK